MKIAGIIAEYNPFHNGHAHHIERVRAQDGDCRATHVVVVMSGDFVQRGEPALLPRAARVRAALACGADLVLELPLPWALASAEGFARGAVATLDALGCVETLSFGSECGALAPLLRVADVMESERFAGLLHYHLDMGLSYAAAQQKAVAALAGAKTAALLDHPNNTLGLNYIRALRRLGSPIAPHTIPRFGAGHDDDVPLGDVASASFIRTLVQAGRLLNAAPYLPPLSRDILAAETQAGRCPSQSSRVERALLARLRTMERADFAALPGISEGLENRLYKAARQADTVEAFLDQVKTKRYPLTRLQRLLWAAFLGLPAAYEQETPPYIRVLGANVRGTEILQAAKAASLPLLTRASQLERLTGRAQALFALESRGADLYALTLPSPPPCGAAYTTGLIRYPEAARRL